MRHDRINGLLQWQQHGAVLRECQRAWLPRTVVQFLAKQLVEVDILPRILIGVVPVICGKVEITRSRQIDVLGLDFSRDVDAALKVAEGEVPIRIADAPTNVQILWCAGWRDAEVVIGFGIGILRDANVT